VKTRFASQGSRTTLDSMMTPMIDVVFLLLVFFLTTASFQRLEKLLPSAVSAESESQAGGTSNEPPKPSESDVSDCVIKINRPEGSGGLQYRFNDTPIASLEELGSRLRAVIRVRPDVPIVVDPEDSITAGDALRVYDLAKSSGALAVYMVAR
jgi:biopolymer transport protein ExbD